MSSSFVFGDRRLDIYTNIALFLGVLASIALLLKYHGHGFDFTDEGYYLAWISNPFLYDYSISQFGFIYYPIFKLVDLDIAKFRLINIAITYSLASAVFFLAMNRLSGRGITLLNRCLLSMAFGTSAFAAYSSWLLTPSYNTLAAQAIMLVASAALLFDALTYRRLWIVLSIAGIGICFLFLAKPPSGLLLGIFFAIYLYISGWRSSIGMALFFSYCLLLISIFGIVVDGSILYFFQRLKIGAETQELLNAGYSLEGIIRWDSLKFNYPEKVLILSTSTFLFLMACVVSKCGPYARIRKFLPYCILAYILSITLILSSNFDMFKRYTPVGGIAFVGISSALGCVAMLNHSFYRIKEIAWKGAFFFAIPLIYAFGTNGNYWVVGGNVGMFYLVGSIVISNHLYSKTIIFYRIIVVTSFSSLLISTLILIGGVLNPYRQSDDLRYQNEIISFGKKEASLYMSKEYAQYIKSAQGIVEQVEFASGTSIIDLSGQSPGLLYAIGAKNVGYPWLAGGYPGSFLFVREWLRRWPCQDLQNAWLLLEPNGPREVSYHVLDGLVANSFPVGYQLMGSWIVPKGVGGYLFDRTQFLYAPQKNSATKDCNEKDLRH